MQKFIVKTDDGEIEVEPSQIQVPDGYVLKDQESFDGLIQSRLERQKSALRDDDAFRQEVLRSAGVPMKNGKVHLPQQPDEQELTERIKAQLKGQMVEPLTQERDRLASQVQALRGQQKKATILEHFGQRVREDVSPEALVTLVGQKLAWHDQAQDFVVTDSDGNPVPSTRADRTWQGADELAERLSATDGYSFLFRDGRPNRSGLGSPEGGGSRRTFTREDFQKGNVDLEAIAKGEASVK